MWCLCAHYFLLVEGFFFLVWFARFLSLVCFFRSFVRRSLGFCFVFVIELNMIDFYFGCWLGSDWVGHDYNVLRVCGFDRKEKKNTNFCVGFLRYSRRHCTVACVYASVRIRFGHRAYEQKKLRHKFQRQWLGIQLSRLFIFIYFFCLLVIQFFFVRRMRVI